jgi:riboflavin kinase/FMN adenylyltransferase
VAGDLALPANGVYAGHLAEEPGGPPRPAATSVGVNPQFHATGLRVEAHVLDFDGDLYGRWVSVSFEHRLRDEAAFATVDDLVAQIHEDIRHARRLLALRPDPGDTVGRGGFPRHTP